MASLNPEDDVQLDTAFQSLLDQRNRDTFVDSFGEPIVQDEDALLCNTNLQTAVIFKNLSKQYSDLTAALAKEKEDKDQMMNSVVAYKKSFKDIFNFYLREIRSSDAINSLQGKHDVMTKEVDLILRNFLETCDINILSLEKKIDDTSRKLNLIRQAIMTGIQGIVKPDDMVKKMCPVCFDREVDRFDNLSLAILPHGLDALDPVLVVRVPLVRKD